MEIVDSIFLPERELKAKAFLAENAAIFDKWRRKIDEETRVSSTYVLLRERRDSYRIFIDSLRQAVSRMASADIPLSILKNLDSDPGATFNLMGHASHFVGVLVLQIHGDKVLSLAEAELVKKSAEMKAFFNEHHAVLKKLGHPPEV